MTSSTTLDFTSRFSFYGIQKTTAHQVIPWHKIKRGLTMWGYLASCIFLAPCFSFAWRNRGRKKNRNFHIHPLKLNLNLEFLVFWIWILDCHAAFLTVHWVNKHKGTWVLFGCYYWRTIWKFLGVDFLIWIDLLVFKFH